MRLEYPVPLFDRFATHWHVPSFDDGKTRVKNNSTTALFEMQGGILGIIAEFMERWCRMERLLLIDADECCQNAVCTFPLVLRFECRSFNNLPAEKIVWNW